MLVWSICSLLVVACRTGIIFSRFSGERGQARGERESRTLRTPRSPQKRKKMPVLHAMLVQQPTKNNARQFKFTSMPT